MSIIESIRRYAYRDAFKTHTIHDHDELIAIGKRRDARFDEKEIANVWCSNPLCQAPLSLQGIVHWPGCDGFDFDIRFQRKKKVNQ